MRQERRLGGFSVTYVMERPLCSMQYAENLNANREFAAQFAQALVSWRKRKGMTQRALAQKAGIANATLHRYESGTLCPSPEIVQKLADALDVQHEDLLNLDNLLKSETVPERIKRMRRLRGITQEELGKMVGTTKSTISICESGRNELRSTTLARIAEALGVSYEYLVLGKPQDGDFLQEGLTPFKKVPVVLAAVEEFGDDHRLVFRTLTIRVPNDGLDWHVMGEVKTDCQQNEE